jgi:hypothetical protein
MSAIPPDRLSEGETLGASSAHGKARCGGAERARATVQDASYRERHTYKDLADMLTGKIKMPRGADRWQATQVKRVLERVGS